MIDRSMKPANANEYPQNACGVFISTLNINQLPSPLYIHTKNLIIQKLHKLSIIHCTLSIVNYY